MKKLFLVLMLLSFAVQLRAADTLTVRENDAILISKKFYEELEDPKALLQAREIINNPRFHQPDDELPEIKYDEAAIWLKVKIRNKTAQPFIPITISGSVIDEFDLYFVGTSKRLLHLKSSNPKFNSNQLQSNLTNINFALLPDSTRTIYLRIKSSANTVIPVQVHSATYFLQSISTQNLILGAFIGMVLVMAAYHLLLFFTVKDISYFYYTLYIISLALTQILLRGVGTNLFQNNQQLLNDIVQPITRMMLGITIILFVYEFLQIKNRGKTLQVYFKGMFIFYCLPLLFVITGLPHIAYNIISVSALMVSVSLLVIGGSLYFKGYTPAKYFMLAWTLFFVSIIVTVLRNQGLVPYNNFTLNIVLYSSAIEFVLFSVALADRINFYRQQHNQAQSAALAIALENERLITEQNLILERKVNERTVELIESNKTLQVSLENLQATQSQLIATEKMASLGQLTAGIAHEINNPINFVSANVQPLRLDFLEVFDLIEKYIAFEHEPDNGALKDEVNRYRQQIDVDYIKQEILTLLEGIEEGALRTKEIVDSLRTFSRTDEQSLKAADINKAILSTLVILRSAIPAYISIQPVLDKLPLINCYPGKISQVFINLISNSIDAIKAKDTHENEFILITTSDYEKEIEIRIKDTGTGISPEAKHRIFDPFYTTKEVGEGTGLGLSIVFGIIEKHQGHIEVESEPGVGTTITVRLPKNLN
ncbi:ATP-binding protein [Mucilaginibacter sp. RS28]|uniref:histidine kinase n=1 Tax=Mucilaginibacter straminoryzae TaxID=2932774 RepID=A0A9X1X5A4_9SPHI|nr:7TM diverse intracellular signaling domain-containing protein [Mucilaginibacter straminoryzae]MCJ8208939.1 ATP-binding protein [Mucilaginibacter straminoryzae]